ncbi:MAG: hypothetical protein WBW78_00550, partial [Terrimicrobiaceae bacterium]
KAVVSSCQVVLSKSAARNQHVSSFQQGINACRQFAAEVVADHRIRQREEFPIRTRLGFS